SLDLHIGAGRWAEWRELAVSGMARGDASGRLPLEPFAPVRPPGPLVLARACDPILEGSAGRPIRPVLIFLPMRRVDDACDMAGAPHHEAHLAAESGGALIGR